MGSSVGKALSRRIVLALQAEGMELATIAREAGTTPAFLRKVLAGEASLQSRHQERLDERHPDLPFRIAAAVVKEEASDLAARAGKVRRKVGSAVKEKGGEALESVGRALRQGAWKLLDLVSGRDRA
jgi:predicted transcriptional regulator